MDHAMDSDFDKYRKEFLLKLYDQLMGDINRHILVVWESVGVLVGAFAVFALVEKKIIPLDYATALIILIAAWALGHILEAAHWYNRNLVIVANIERQFLKVQDLREIHYYFGKHRKVGSMLDQLKLQCYLVFGAAALFLYYHFKERVVPGIGNPWSSFDVNRALPYLILVVASVWMLRHNRRAKQKYEEFLKNSPGIDVDTTGIEYGIGHPVETNSLNREKPSVGKPEHKALTPPQIRPKGPEE